MSDSKRTIENVVEIIRKMPYQFTLTEMEKFTSLLNERLDEILKIHKGEKEECMAKINWDEVDKYEIAKSVVLLDMFTKTFCRYRNDYERFDDLKFRCSECHFQKEDGDCLLKLFKNKYAPDYKDFGSMGDL